MATTLVRPLQIDDVTAYDDTRASDAGLETNATMEGIVGAIISQIQNVTGNTNWWDAVTRTVETLNTDLADLEGKKLLCTANLLTDVSVPSSQNWAVLTVTSSETPSEVIAVALTVDGAVCAQLGTGDFGSHNMDEISGPDALNPKNLVVLRDASTGQAIQSAGRDVFGLLQVEDGATDGAAFNDTTNQAQISFVRPNSSFDGLELCPVVDIENKSINYSYVFRTDLDALGEDCNLANRNFTDLTASVDVTLDNAIDNQAGAATQTQNIEVRITDGFDWAFQDSVGADIFTVAAAGAGDTVTAAGATTNITSTTFDVDSTTNDFANGVTVDSGSTGIDIAATTAGVIDRAAALTVQATGDTLTLQTVTSGTLNVTSAAGIINTSGAGSNITNTTGAGSSGAGGEFDVTTGVGDAGFSGGVIDMQTGAGGVGGSGSDGGDGGDFTLNLGDGGIAAEGATPDDAGAGGSLAYVAGAGGAADGTDSGGILGGDAGLGGNLSFTAGAGGAGSAGTVDPGQAATGGTVNLTAGAGGAGAGTSDNGDGGDVVLTSGAPGTGGTGTAGTRGVVRMVSGGDYLHEVAQLENTTETVQMFAGAVSPSGTVDGLAGSIYMRDTGSGGQVWVNTSTGSGTTWVQLDAAGASTADRQDVYDNDPNLTITADATLTLNADDRFWDLSDSGSASLFRATSDVGGSASTVALGSAVDVFDVNAVLNDFDGTTFDALMSGAISLDAGAASNFTADGGDLTLSTTTSGSALIDGVDGVEVNSSGGAISVGNDAATGAINVGTGVAARTITVGNATGATSVNLDAGTGGFTMDSTVGEASALIAYDTTGGTNGDTASVFVGDSDPSAATGIAAPESSVFHRGTATDGELWLKTGAADTAWTRIATLTDVASSDTLSEVVTNQAGTAFLAGAFNTQWGITNGQSVEFQNSGGTALLAVDAASGADGIRSTVATFDVNTTGLFSVDSTAGAVSLQGAAASDFTTSAGNLTMEATTGNLNGLGLNINMTGIAAAAAGDITLAAATSSGATNSGGDVFINSGGGATTGAGGVIDMNGGSGGTTGAGGAINIDAGAGGSTSGAGGAIAMNSGSAATAGAGGAMTVSAGAGAGTGNGGAALFSSGDAGTTGSGGDLTMDAGDGGSTSGPAGRVFVNGGNSVDSTAGNVTISGGTSTSSTGGQVSISAGSSTSGNGAEVRLTSGAGSAGNGIVVLRSAADSNVSELDGVVQIHNQGTGTGGGDSIEQFVINKDPTTASGIAANVGSIAYRNVGGSDTAGEIWVKTGAADTAWSQVDIGGVSGSLEAAWEASTGTTPAVLANDFTGEISDGDLYTIRSETGNHDFLAFTALAAGDSWTLGTDDGGTGTGVITSGSGGVSVTGGVTGSAALTGGAGSTSAGATASVTGGAGDGANAGGVASLTGGASGAGATGDGGDASVTGGAAASTNGSGGAVSVQGGALSGTGSDGAIGIGDATAGAIRIGINAGGTEIADTMSIGSVGSMSLQGEGTVSISSGAAGSASADLSLTAGDGSSSAGNDVTVTAGDGAGTDQAGGGITLTAGAATGTGTQGVVTIANDAAASNDDPVMTLNGSGTEIVSFYADTATPTVSANTGSLAMVDTGASATSGLYVNVSASGAGTDWEKVSTASNNLTRVIAQVTADSQISSGTDVTDSNTTAVNGTGLPDTSGVTFATEVAVYVNGVRMLNGSGNDVIQGASAASGDLNFPSLTLESGDVVTVEVWDADA